MALPLRDQMYQYLRYEGLQYTEADIADFKSRLTRIHRRVVHRVQVFDYGGFPDLMAEGLSTRMLMEHRDAQGVSLFTIRAWRRLFDIRGPLVDSAREIPNKGDLRDYWIGISSARDFLGTAPSCTAIQDPILRLCHRLIACSIAGRSQAAEKGLMIIALELLIIDMAELVRLQICVEVDDTWAWVAMGPERQPDAAAGALGVAQDASVIDEGG
ncbi:hypothetical protein Tco_1297329 [Tanacetum coccineum]